MLSAIPSLFVEGGFFMIPITLIAAVVLWLAVRKSLQLYAASAPNPALKQGIHMIVALGGLAFFIGVLAQSIGLMQMFNAIEMAGGVSTSLLAGGLKVSLIPTVVSLTVFVGAGVVWMVLSARYNRLAEHRG